LIELRAALGFDQAHESAGAAESYFNSLMFCCFSFCARLFVAHSASISRGTIFWTSTSALTLDSAGGLQNSGQSEEKFIEFSRFSARPHLEYRQIGLL